MTDTPPLSEELYLGVDGGGSLCRARICDAKGRRLGEGTGGPANITTDLEGAAASILDAARAAAAAAGLGTEQLHCLDAVFGMAGANASEAAAKLKQRLFPFAHVTVTSDTEIACLGAHGGADGGILVLGTGSQGVVRQGGSLKTIGGWGFALSDSGSGAVLGQVAARHALAAFEGLAEASAFTHAVMARFEHKPPVMLRWALKAIPRDYATLAPLLFEFADRNDPVALALLEAAVADVEKLIDRMAAHGAERIALMGGLAFAYRPRLHPRFDDLLVAPMGDALDGALLLAKAKAAPR